MLWLGGMGEGVSRNVCGRRIEFMREERIRGGAMKIMRMEGIGKRKKRRKSENGGGGDTKKRGAGGAAVWNKDGGGKKGEGGD